MDGRTTAGCSQFANDCAFTVAPSSANAIAVVVELGLAVLGLS